MAYDPVDGYLVLFGGCDSGNFWFSTCTPTNQTWVYQNGSWSQLSPTVSPPARYDASLAWDGEAQSLVLFGGNGSVTTGFLNDTWTFVHGQWTQQHPTVSPPARAAAAMVYDARDGYVLLVDGEQVPDPHERRDVHLRRRRLQRLLGVLPAGTGRSSTRPTTPRPGTR